MDAKTIWKVVKVVVPAAIAIVDIIVNRNKPGNKNIFEIIKNRKEAK